MSGTEAGRIADFATIFANAKLRTVFPDKSQAQRC